MTKNIFNWNHISSNLTQDQITESKITTPLGGTYPYRYFGGVPPPPGPKLPTSWRDHEQ